MMDYQNVPGETLSEQLEWLRRNRYILNNASERPDHPHSIKVSADEAIERMADLLAEDPLAGVAIWDTQADMQQPVVWARDGEVNVPPPDAGGWWAVGSQMSAIISAAMESREAQSDE